MRLEKAAELIFESANYFQCYVLSIKLLAVNTKEGAAATD